MQPFKDPSLRHMAGPGGRADNTLGAREGKLGPVGSHRSLWWGRWGCRERGSEGWSVGIRHRGVKGHGIWKGCWRKVILAAVEG